VTYGFCPFLTLNSIIPLKKEENGVWKKITLLLPGRYKYKFLVDGRWQNDSASDRLCVNCFGTQNNVIEVKPG